MVELKENKVVFFIDKLTGGGAEKVCVNISNGLVSKNWDVTILVVNLNNAKYLHLIDKRVKLEVLGSKKIRFAYLKILTFINKNQPKFFIVFNFELSILLIILRFINKLNFYIISRNINTFSINSTDLKFNVRGLFYKSFIRNIYLKSDCIINQCNAMKKDFEHFFKTSNNNVVIYNPVFSVTIPKQNEIKIDNEYLLCIGRLENQKSMDRAIKIFKEISQDFPRLRLKIIGEGSLKSDLVKLSKNMNIFEKIDFIDFQLELSNYYNNAKCLLLTSKYEGFPNVILESLSFGVPVISFNCPSGPDEIIINGINGYLVTNNDIPEFVAKLKILLCQKFSKSEIVGSIDKFSLENIVKDYETLLLRFK